LLVPEDTSAGVCTPSRRGGAPRWVFAAALPMAAVLFLAAAFVAHTGNSTDLASSSADASLASRRPEEQQQPALRPPKAIPDFEVLVEERLEEEDEEKQHEDKEDKKKGHKEAKGDEPKENEKDDEDETKDDDKKVEKTDEDEKVEEKPEEDEHKEKEKPKVVPDADMVWQSDQMKKAMEKNSDLADTQEELAKGAAKRYEEEKKEEERRKKEKAEEEKALKKARAEAKEKAEKLAKEEAKERAAEEAKKKKERSDETRSMLLGAMSEIFFAAPPKEHVKADGFYKISFGKCADSDLYPVKYKFSCTLAGKKLNLSSVEAQETDATHRPEGCYFHKDEKGSSLWLGINHHNQGHGCTADREQICMSEARHQHEEQKMAEFLEKQAEKEALENLREKKEAARRKKELAKKKKEEAKEKEERKEEEALQKWERDEKKVPNVTLYCFSLMMPFGYEPGLLAEQKKRKVGIYACDEPVVFSNVTHLVTTGERSPVPVTLMSGSLAVAYGGRWMTALNTGVFNRLWMEVIRLGRYRYHDWVVKVDPDAVFFPSRLRQLLRHKAPYNEPEVQRRVPEPENLRCGTCRLENKTTETCAAHVRFWQQKGHSCKEALRLTAREPPTDCGCDCDDFACDLPKQAVYLNNCKWGLHGPIEVLSRRAVATYAAGLPKCVDLLQHPWGEDKFLDQCMQQLGVTRENEYSLLSETACGEQPAPCGTANVAFHPFKSIQSYFTCFEYADKYGEGPAAPPWVNIDEGSDNVDDIVMK